MTHLVLSSSLMLGDDNVFGVHYTAFNDDSVLQRLHQDGTFSEAEKKFSARCLESVDTLLQRQMKEYYPGDTLAEPSEDLLKLTKSELVHSIFAERTLGTADSAIRMSPIATITYIDCYIRVVHNHTYKFLDDLP